MTAIAASSDGQTTYSVSSQDGTLIVGNADGSQRQVLQNGSMGTVRGLTGASDVAVSPPTAISST